MCARVQRHCPGICELILIHKLVDLSRLFVMFCRRCGTARRLPTRHWQSRVMPRWQSAAKNDLKRTTKKDQALMLRPCLKFAQKLPVIRFVRGTEEESMLWTCIRSRRCRGAAGRREGCRATSMRITTFRIQLFMPNDTVQCDGARRARRKIAAKKSAYITAALEKYIAYVRLPFVHDVYIDESWYEIFWLLARYFVADTKWYFCRLSLWSDIIVTCNLLYMYTHTKVKYCYFTFSGACWMLFVVESCCCHSGRTTVAYIHFSVLKPICCLFSSAIYVNIFVYIFF